MFSALSSHPTLTPNLNTTLRPNSTPTPSISLARSLAHLNYDTLLSIEPLTLFLAQLDTQSAETRVDAMRRLFVVANAIGREATLNQLIPYLSNHVNKRSELAAERSQAAAVPTGSDEDDEILLILAEQVGQMVISGLIPGYRALTVLPILEKLAGVEETVVRDKAVESINCVIPTLAVDSITVRGKEEEEARVTTTRNAPGLLLAMIKRMAGADWFTAKISACAVLPCVYQYFNTLKNTTMVSASPHAHGLEDGGGVTVEDIKTDLRNLYRMLSEDDAPMVRRGAGRNLGRYAEAVAKLPYGKKGSSGGPIAKEFVIPGGKDESMIKKTVLLDLRNKVMEDVVPVYQTLANDEQDSVRLLAVSSSGSLGCALGLDGNMCGKVVLPIIKAHSADLSWRVRNHLAKDFAVVAQSQGFHEASHKANLDVIFESFTGLLQDFEAEVRTSAVENIARMVQLGGVDLFKSHLSPLLPSLAEDPNFEVRSKLAQTIMDCCDDSICTALSDKVILQDFKPLLEGFLKDEYAEVQLHILSKLSRVTHLLSQMDVVVQSILAMSKAMNWRVREAVGCLLPHLAEARGVKFFEEQLLELWMKLLMDQVADVRSACVRGMPKLVTVTGSTWVEEQIMPRYTQMYDDGSNYLTRITILRSYTEFAKAEKTLSKELLEVVVTYLLKGLEDRVPNVRIIAAKGLEQMTSVVDKGILSTKIQPALQSTVTEDTDDDCQFFAQKALDSITD